MNFPVCEMARRSIIQNELRFSLTGTAQIVSLLRKTPQFSVIVKEIVALQTHLFLPD